MLMSDNPPMFVPAMGDGVCTSVTLLNKFLSSNPTVSR